MCCELFVVGEFVVVVVDDDGEWMYFFGLVKR